MSASVKVTGLRELRRELRRLEPASEWQPALKAAGRAAGQIVADDATSSAAAGATTISGKHASMGSAALATIRVLAQQARVFIAGGRASLAYYGGWEFGSSGRHRQFPPKRGADGYNIYPAIAKNRDEIIQTYVKGIGPLLERAFPD